MKKALIVTYYWPPAGGPGVQRVVRFVRYFRQFGWEPIVLTVKNGDYPAIDETLHKQLPENLRIEKTDILEPYAIYRKFTGKSAEEKIPTFVLSGKSSDSKKDRLAKWVRGNIFIPDARIGWIPNAVRAGSKLIREENIDLIFATSPPHTVQLIAKKLAKRHKIPWVADLRDPWTEAFWAEEMKKSRLADAIDRKLERSVLQQANLITTVSEGLGKIFLQKGALACEVIHNGFEPKPPQPLKSDKFMLLFFGHLNKSQNPETLFRSLCTLPDAIRENLKIVFVGRIFEGFAGLFEKFGQQLAIERRNYMPLDEVLAFARSASILLHPMISATYIEGVIGAKMFDYLSLQKPILTLGEKNGIVREVLQETESGEIVEYADLQGIADFVLEKYKIWQKNSFVLLDNSDKLSNYTTETNTLKLLNLFNALIGR